MDPFVVAALLCSTFVGWHGTLGMVMSSLSVRLLVFGIYPRKNCHEIASNANDDSSLFISLQKPLVLMAHLHNRQNACLMISMVSQGTQMGSCLDFA